MNIRPPFCFNTIYLLIMRLYIVILLSISFISCSSPAKRQPPIAATGKTDTTSRIMPDSLKTQLLHEINLSVKSGFYSSEETLDNVKQIFDDDSLDEQWVISHINRAYAQVFNAQTQWPQLLGFDRLAKAFDKLNQHHIIALHNQGITREDGEDGCKELHKTLKKEGINTRGYCFYHGQDVGHVIETKTLYIAFGDFDDNDRKAVSIGKELVKALKEQGFKVVWNNTAATRIEIIGFTWRKRFGNGNCSYDRAVMILKGY